MPQCWIGLGGNQGSVADTFRQSVALLNSTPGLSVTQMSCLYTTSPVGAAAGPMFLNAAAELHTTLAPIEVLAALQSVETQLGRERLVHWGPRTLDLDLLLYDQLSLNAPTLTIPHPHMWYRRFVLDPLTEIAPHAMHCLHGLTVHELRRRLLARPLKCMLLNGDADLQDDLQRRLVADFPETEWGGNSPADAWLIFSLVSTPSRPDLEFPNRIDVSAFPTPPERTIREVLGAALDTVRIH